MPISSAIASPRACAHSGGLCRDLAGGLRQQMVFWGRDVVHSRGNLLLAQGFEKSKSAGLQSSSCYGLGWEGGRVELHGACAGWFPEDEGEGFLFIRPLGKCHVWKGGAHPVPGEWPAALLDSTAHARVLELIRPFLRWWLQSEAWIDELLGSSYRDACHRHLKRLPKGNPWLHPAAGMEWVEQLARDEGAVARAKRYRRRPWA
ncbi:MAG TPA: hypothetical protein VGE67_05450 [Haloferula sp.]